MSGPMGSLNNSVRNGENDVLAVLKQDAIDTLVARKRASRLECTCRLLGESEN